MAMCPYCHSEKSMFAPVCNECNHDTPFFFQLGCQVIYITMTFALFIGFFWGIKELFGS